MTSSHNITQLLLVIVQSQDADRAEKAASDVSLYVSRISSVGGFLRQRNVTFLIGANETCYDEIVKALRENCLKRVEYITIPLEGVPLPLPAQTPITIGGAHLFSFDVEHFEEV